MAQTALEPNYEVPCMDVLRRDGEPFVCLEPKWVLTASHEHSWVAVSDNPRYPDLPTGRPEPAERL